MRIFCLLAAATLAAVLGLVSGGRNVALGQADTGSTWTYEWTAPTTGSPAAYYLVEIVVNNVDTIHFERVAATRVDVPVELGSDYKVRVMAFDASDRPGPYSGWSQMETFEEDPPSNQSGSAGR